MSEILAPNGLPARSTKLLASDIQRAKEPDLTWHKDILAKSLVPIQGHWFRIVGAEKEALLLMHDHAACKGCAKKTKAAEAAKGEKHE